MEKAVFAVPDKSEVNLLTNKKIFQLTYLEHIGL